MTRPKLKPPPCAVCELPRTWDEKRAVYVCRNCQPKRARDSEQRQHVTLYEGVEVDST